jgi:hypothetical protein
VARIGEGGWAVQCGAGWAQGSGAAGGSWRRGWICAAAQGKKEALIPNDIAEEGLALLIQISQVNPNQI